jgi:hypothetical protein
MPKISNLPSTSVVNLTDILPLVSPEVSGTTKKATFEKVLDAFVASGAFLDSNLDSGEILVGDVSNVATAVSMSGDATLSNVGALTLSNTPVTPGSYTVNGKSLFTVDSKGRLTNATNAVISSADITGEALTSVDDTNVTLTLGGSPATALLKSSSITAGWSGTLAVSRGGTGTGTAFTPGSIVFAGSGGVYSQDNTNLYWDNGNNRLGIGDSAPSTTLAVRGVFSIANGVKSSNAGISTFNNTDRIRYGINDGSQNSFGGAYSPTLQGGFFQANTNSSFSLFEFYGRTANVSGDVALLSFLTSAGNFALSSGALATTATDGFPYIPTCNGTPTGIPTSLSGLAPIVWDSSNHQLYVYGSGWEKTITSGASLTRTNDANVTITLGGSPNTALVNSASLTMGWSGQLSLARGGTNASLTASDGGVVYSSASALQILPASGGLNNILVTSISGAPHWTLSSFPDSCAVGNMLICNTTNIWSVLTGVANSVMTSNASGVAQWTATLPVARGGTGTGTAFTTGSVIFAGASGVYSQNNANFFWSNTNLRLSLATTSSITTLNVNGIISIFNGGIKTLNAGVATEVNAQLINIGLNDGLGDRFGGTYTSASSGGFFRVDSRTAANFQWFARPAGFVGGASLIATLTNNFVFSIIGGASPGSIVITGGPVAGEGSNLKIYGGGTTGSSVAINMSSYDPAANNSAAQIKCVDVGGFGNDIQFLSKTPGLATNPLQIRFFIPSIGGLVIGDNATVLSTTTTTGFIYIPFCAGPPTAVPATFTGTVPLIYDSVNNRLYSYNGAWRSVTLV